MQNLCLWKPDQDRMQHSNLHQFMAEVNHFHGLQLRSYADLYQWSVEKTTRFWPLVWQHCGVKGELGDIVAENRQEMQRARWFPDSRLNFAENLLRRQDESPAIISRLEGGVSQTLSWAELGDQVARLAQWLRSQGIGRGDVAGAPGAGRRTGAVAPERGHGPVRRGRRLSTQYFGNRGCHAGHHQPGRYLDLHQPRLR